MAKKKRKNKDNRKAVIKLKEQYDNVMDRVVESHEEKQTPDKIKKDKNIISSKVFNMNYISVDLMMVFALVVFFSIAIGVLYYFEIKNNFLSPLSNRLMEFLLK